MGNIGEVKGRDVVIVDELIDTGGTLAALPLRLKKAGAMVREVDETFVLSAHACVCKGCCP